MSLAFSARFQKNWETCRKSLNFTGVFVLSSNTGPNTLSCFILLLLNTEPESLSPAMSRWTKSVSMCMFSMLLYKSVSGSAS